MGVEPKIGGKHPKWMVKIMENPTNKWMIRGENPLFLEKHPYDWRILEDHGTIEGHSHWVFMFLLHQATRRNFVQVLGVWLEITLLWD